MVNRHQQRRARTESPLASPAGVKRICALLCAACPQLQGLSDKELVSLFNAVRHVERYPVSTARGGRPSRWPRAELLDVATQLRGILQRETQGKVSLASFVGIHLRILLFPADVTTALETNAINLQEALALARLTAERLHCSVAEADELRRETLAAHVRAQGSQNSLRQRVSTLLGETESIVTAATMQAAVEQTDELLAVTPDDSRHLFYEQIRQLFYTLREIKPEDIDETDLEEFSEAADELFSLLYRISQKSKRRKQAQVFQI